MSLSDDTKAIIASNLTVAYNFLHESNYFPSAPDREEKIRKHVIGSFKTMLSELNLSLQSSVHPKTKA
jgi:histidinol phosphatase-like enzyme